MGLAAIAASGPFAVVVSDMRMPQMDGARFLAQVREIAPDTVRMALTGQTDIDTAMAAVNEGRIFRFMTKPCSRENLQKAVESGLAQHRLISCSGWRDVPRSCRRGPDPWRTKCLRGPELCATKTLLRDTSTLVREEFLGRVTLI